MLDIMSGLKNQGYPVLNIINGWNNGHFASLLQEAGIPYRALYIGKISKRLHLKYIWWTLNALCHLPLALYKLKKIIRQYQPDVLIFDSYYTASLTKSVLGNTPVIIRYAETPANDFFFRQLRKTRFFNRIRHVGISKFIVQQIGNMDIPSNSISLIYNGFHTPPIHETSNLNSDAPLTIGFIGQIAPWKGIQDFLSAAVLLNSRGYKLRYLIAGRGDSKFVHELMTYTQQNQIDEIVQWMGYLNEPALFFPHIQICVIPTVSEEPFGRVAVEAGLRGIPVIATKSGALPEIVENQKTGFIVPIRSPETIARKIAFFVEHPGERILMGDNARAVYSQKFSIDHQIKEWANIIEGIHFEKSQQELTVL